MAETKNKKKYQPPVKKRKGFDIEESFGKAEVYYQKNSKVVNTVAIIIIVLIGGYFAYKYLYKAPREKKAQTMVFKAQQYFARDSFRLALNGDGNNYGYLQVISRYGNTKAGELAKYSAGVCYVHLGDFKKGIEYLKKFDADDKVVQAMDYGLMGDAYMELGNTTEGINYYKKAAHYNENDLISPFYLKRAALASEKAGNTQDAIALFKEIKNKYPLSQEGRDIDKYLARLGVVKD